jgi:hypothetical protein
MQSNRYLNELVGRRVAIWSGGEHAGARDEGIFEGFDGVVIRLRKENRDKHESFLFPIYRVRLIRALDEG